MDGGVDRAHQADARRGVGDRGGADAGFVREGGAADAEQQGADQTAGGGFAGVTDETLAAVGLSRRVALSVPHFLFVLQALQASDLVAMLPERLVRAHGGLQLCEPPVRVPGSNGAREMVRT